ncbi:MAG: imidazole glycerol phosphate synthase subunit HisH [candidate division Zixibacteria bacterium]|nr:imidazole glycerol phosphate synthase subunit HisH [Candidatus Tariuqbacter arcticus]
MICVIDYGAGNLPSVKNALEAVGQKSLLARNAGDLERAGAIILPGVGAFGDGMKTLKEMKLLDALNEQVLHKKKPYLGICLGLQFLGKSSEEHGCHKGFGWLEGEVKRIVPKDKSQRVPHIGWNNIHISKHCSLFDGLDEEPVFYFVHSYSLVMDRKDGEATTAIVNHGRDLVAAVQKDNIYGVQFHPEKSQRNGLIVLENFVKLIE